MNLPLEDFGLLIYEITNVDFVIHEDQPGTGIARITIRMSITDNLKSREKVVENATRLAKSLFKIDISPNNISVIRTRNKEGTPIWVAHIQVETTKSQLRTLRDIWLAHGQHIKGVEFEEITPKPKPSTPKLKIVRDPMVYALKKHLRPGPKRNKLIKTWMQFNKVTREDVDFIERFLVNNVDHLKSEFAPSSNPKTLRTTLSNAIRKPVA